MSSGYFEKKNDIADLRSRLQNALAKKDTRACTSAIKKIIQYMTLGIDVSDLFTDVIMACVTKDIVQKKLVYFYICSCAEFKSNLALLTVNTLVKDASTDHNPMVRGLALRSMLNMRLPMIVEYVKQPLLEALDDRSSYVRRNAVIGCLKFFHLAPDQFEELGIEKKLEEKVQDSDSQVAMNAFLCLEEVFQDTGGVPFTKDLVHRLLLRLPDVNEWSQCILLSRISRYEPSDEDEILQYLNFLDDRLNHANKGIVLAAINLFLHFTKNLDYLKKDIFDRIRPPILSILTSAIPEIAFATLKNVSVLIKMKPRLFHNDFKFFFLRMNDPTYVCHEKLEILTDIITEGNMMNIIEELRQYASNSDLMISSKAVKAIGTVALKNSFALEVGTNILLEMLKYEEDHLVDHCLQCLQELMMNFTSISSLVLPEIPVIWDSIQHYSAGKSALVWIYGEYGEEIPSSPYKLEELVNNIKEIDLVTIKLNLLTAMMKLFFKRPPECQRTLGRLLKYCIDEENNMDVRDRAMLFYRLLQHNKEKAKEVVFSKKPGQTYYHKSVDILQCNDFRFREFNTLSVIYGQPSSTFLMNCKYQNEPSTDTEETTQNLPNEPRNNHQANEPVTVPVENFLDLDINEEESTKLSNIELDPSINIEADDFKSKWSSPHVKTFTEELTIAPEHHEILSVMQNENIKCRAANKPTAPQWKFFFYAKQMNSSEIFLIELILQRNPTTTMKVQIKSTHNEKLDDFVDFYKQLFVGRWIALTP